MSETTDSAYEYESPANTGDLSADERAELAQLRAEKESRDNAPAEENAPAERELPDTHWIHLANGDVITAKGVASHIDGIPVIGTYEIPAHLQEGAETPESAHKF